MVSALALCCGTFSKHLEQAPVIQLFFQIREEKAECPSLPRSRQCSKRCKRGGFLLKAAQDEIAVCLVVSVIQGGLTG